MNRRQGIAFAVAAFVFAALVGALAYYAGVHTAVEGAGGRGAYPYPYPHFWGFGFFVPLFFIFFWFVLLRGLIWRGRCGYAGHLDEWHRRAHERMGHGEQDDPDRRR